MWVQLSVKCFHLMTSSPLWSSELGKRPYYLNANWNYISRNVTQYTWQYNVNDRIPYLKSDFMDAFALVNWSFDWKICKFYPMSWNWANCVKLKWANRYIGMAHFDLDAAETYTNHKLLKLNLTNSKLKWVRVRQYIIGSPSHERFVTLITNFIKSVSTG